MTNAFGSLFDIPFPDAPDAAHERDVQKQLGGIIAGIDEAGRGPWAGPVVISAVSLDYDALPDGLNDSKKLSEAKREALFDDILRSAHVSVCVQSPETIDRLNILRATLEGMVKCAKSLAVEPQMFFVDGRDAPAPLLPKAQALIKGDGRCLAISAASIVAKVMRDRMMVRLEETVPGYGFAKHKGYGTKDHQEALKKLGVTEHHRRSFRPIAAML
ncbi:ribonuclease HII [Rhodobacteraceae bacterium RKSG542]|uniref:ribonuclease HII n=1 Tax=Pseudovibrio flavus TaxID=2529854 RepID=UPI0012BCA4AE|nr:ribonuclease HII [Pseudovibrio flavus]MTI18685.1 ribonuclease HII [Pseudovibrio flavus]